MAHFLTRMMANFCLISTVLIIVGSSVVSGFIVGYYWGTVAGTFAALVIPTVVITGLEVLNEMFVATTTASKHYE